MKRRTLARIVLAATALALVVPACAATYDSIDVLDAGAGAVERDGTRFELADTTELDVTEGEANDEVTDVVVDIHVAGFAVEFATPPPEGDARLEDIGARICWCDGNPPFRGHLGTWRCGDGEMSSTSPACSELIGTATFRPGEEVCERRSDRCSTSWTLEVSGMTPDGDLVDLDIVRTARGFDHGCGAGLFGL